MHASRKKPKAMEPFGPDAAPEPAPRFFAAALPVVALCVLAVIWGGFAVLSGWFPGRQLRHAYEGAKALKACVGRRGVAYSPDMWLPDRYGVSGLGRYDPARAFTGYTLYTVGSGEKAELVAMDGTVVHKWRASFRDVLGPEARRWRMQPDRLRMWRKAHLFPNGDLLAIVIANGVTPWGRGLIKLDKDSNVIWAFLENVHHDFAFTPDGRIVTLTHRIRNEPVERHPALQPPFIEDTLVFLSPTGEKLEELPLFEAFENSRFAFAQDRMIRSDFGEYLHANAVKVVDAKAAAAFPFAREGQVLVSLALPNALILVDVENRSVEWVVRGSWIYQHDPDLLDNGHILLFDNYGALTPGGSRVIEIDPITTEIVWSFEGTPDEPFSSPQRSAQQALPNGNLFITESDRGRLLEVTRSKEVVWEYVPRERAGRHRELTPVVCWGTRIAADALDEEFRARLETHPQERSPTP
jgi:hypothetical protein